MALPLRIYCNRCKKEFKVYSDENGQYSLEHLKNVNDGDVLVELKHIYVQRNGWVSSEIKNVELVSYRCWCCHEDVDKLDNENNKIDYSLFISHYSSNQLWKCGFCYKCAREWLKLSELKKNLTKYGVAVSKSSFGLDGLWQCRYCKAWSLKWWESKIGIAPDRKKYLPSWDK